MRKPAFCICHNKGIDQLCGDHAADHHLCFRYKDSTISLLSKAKISSLKPFSVAVQPSLYLTWSETPMINFLATWLIWDIKQFLTLSPLDKGLGFKIDILTNQIKAQCTPFQRIYLLCSQIFSN